MRICGRTWVDEPDNPYIDRIVGGVKVKVHATADPIRYDCELCTVNYLHWLCDDRVWHRLPAVLHNRVICPCCFIALRKLAKLEKRAKH